MASLRRADPPPDPLLTSLVTPSTTSPRSDASELNSQLQRELDRLDHAHRRRSLRPVRPENRYVHRDGQRLLNLASNDYLGLSLHPSLRDAVARAARAHGSGATSSRLVVGHFDLHAQVEARFAAFKHAEAALVLPTGFMANLAVLTSLAREGDLVCLDKLVHASLIDAARASGAAVRSFPHLQLDRLERLLSRHVEQAGEVTDPLTGLVRCARRLVVTDSVFSMDGDTADLPGLLEVCERYAATLVVDEAHGTGVLGDRGSGLAEAQGVAGRVPITISTASKALGGLGGMVTADRVVIDTLVNRARSLIYTTGVPPTQLAAIDAALDLVEAEPGRRERLRILSTRMRSELSDRGWQLPEPAHVTPILPLLAGEPEAALALAERLEQHGILGVAIRPPTVAPGTSRVRLCLRADLDDDECDKVLSAIGTPRGDRV
ncbi:MAG: aminotransferase class I/II-fold pyridoxal phosphate-dependent enzyme [Phycisphaeraceae bacterium]